MSASTTTGPTLTMQCVPGSVAARSSSRSSSSCVLACSPGLPHAMFSSPPAPPPRRRLHAQPDMEVNYREQLKRTPWLAAKLTPHMHAVLPGIASTASSEHAGGTSPRAHRTCCRLRRALLGWCSPATCGPPARTARHSVEDRIRGKLQATKCQGRPASEHLGMLAGQPTSRQQATALERSAHVEAGAPAAASWAARWRCGAVTRHVALLSTLRQTHGCRHRMCCSARCIRCQQQWWYLGLRGQASRAGCMPGWAAPHLEAGPCPPPLRRRHRPLLPQ